MFMDDKDKNKFKPGMPPLPPGMAKPSLPPLPPGGKPSLPPMPGMPGMQQPSFPAMPQGFGQPPAAPMQAQKDTAEAESRRMQEEKDKLEKKIGDMEKMLSAEKEKALLATLKNQQDEALSSRVESSLKDIQEKMRRDRRDHEVEEERLTLRSKIKELESRLAQERETWMQTLKEQMSERETQGRDVEGHFIYRLQEMERRWLDEKAQWQKEISSREELIRSLKSSAEKLRDVEDEFRKVSLEKSMTEREASKLRDDVARAEREKAAVEGWIKMMPEKEREIADLRSENAALRGREETSRLEASHRDDKNRYEAEKLQGEIGRLQAEIGTLSDRKNSEMNEALRKAGEGYEAQLQEKEKTIADISGEKVRAISELMKIKGFVSRVQAINAVLEKERGQLKLEKMQLAQNMAAQLEELRRLKAESDGLKAGHQAELEAQSARFTAELENAKNSLGADMSRQHAEKTAALTRAHQEEFMRLSTEAQEERSRAAAAHQAEVARLAGAHQAEIAKISAERQAEFDAKISQLRMKYEASSEEEKIALKRQMEAAYSGPLEEAKAAASAALDAKARLEAENRRLQGEASVFDKILAEKVKNFEERVARAEAELRLREDQAALLSAQKAEAEKAAQAVEAERQRLSAEYAALREGYAALAAQKAAADGSLLSQEESFKAQAESLRVEGENRARFESELLFLKQKIQQMEFQSQETAAALEAERVRASKLQAAGIDQAGRDSARIHELSAELDRYKALESSFAERLKWAIKGKKQ
ncbi:MAG TPA: hypothetical protein DEQ38_00580 [Elusimicrobia bacterium]|nr:MAG: hypothetical protein A2089_05240 [Elusimicrobia bacterium GWD2_63_28]HCC46608.1 hypothetical protein [Elusimicrobiota bacterium]